MPSSRTAPRIVSHRGGLVVPFTLLTGAAIPIAICYALPMQRNTPSVYRVAVGFGLLLFLLAGCSDEYSEPILLANQEALSDVYEDRPMYSSLYYEGRYEHVGEPVHVFVLRVVSKFTPWDAYTIYYLPLEAMEITTDVGRYAGEGALRRTHAFLYDHDDAQFRLRQARRDLEVIPADFVEEYSFRESRCRKAVQEVAESPGSYPLTRYAAETCYWSGNYEQSKTMTARLKDNMAHFDRYTSEGQMLHDYHTLAGRHLLREGEVERAKAELLLSLDVRPSAVMSSFGPNLELANELLQAGQTDAVLAYLDGCAGFWGDAKIDGWKQAINEGRAPQIRH
jgi:hypothetical protein